MGAPKGASRRFVGRITEDWLAVAVGLLLVILVLAGVLRNVP